MRGVLACRGTKQVTCRCSIMCQRFFWMLFMRRAGSDAARGNAGDDAQAFWDASLTGPHANAWQAFKDQRGKGWLTCRCST